MCTKLTGTNACLTKYNLAHSRAGTFRLIDKSIIRQKWQTIPLSSFSKVTICCFFLCYIIANWIHLVCSVVGTQRPSGKHHLRLLRRAFHRANDESINKIIICFIDNAIICSLVMQKYVNVNQKWKNLKLNAYIYINIHCVCYFSPFSCPSACFWAPLWHSVLPLGFSADLHLPPPLPLALELLCSLNRNDSLCLWINEDSIHAP